MQLSESLGITDRAVSKRECGKRIPDSSLMLDLCNILVISVNELLNGEVIEMTEYNQKAERHLIEMAKERDRTDKELLRLEIFVGVLITVILISCVFIVAYVTMDAYFELNRRVPNGTHGGVRGRFTSTYSIADAARKYAKKCNGRLLTNSLFSDILKKTKVQGVTL